jgi:radical SAM superfamily enzyme YgiQ (UPF0313 family)
MKHSRLVLINPVNPARVGLTVNRSSRFPPIGLGIVAAASPSSWEVKLLDENWEPFSYQDADLVGITAFTASSNRAYHIASLYRQRGVPVVIGGIHASIRPEEALHYADAVVIGEAEAIWPHVLSDVEAGYLQKIYKGGWPDLSGAPSPRSDLFDPRYMFASVQTSRGCPMDCEFCSVTTFNGKRYRRRPPEVVLAELETIPQKMIFFVDDNIIGYGKESREQALAIFKNMAESKLNKWWFCQASLNFGDDEEVLYWASRAGCKMVFLGLEAEEEGALKEVEKQLNINRGVDYYSQAFRRINKAGIAVLGAFIFGMDGDTPDKLQQRADFMIRSQIDVMQTTFLTPLPGTRVFNRYCKEKRLLYTDFPIDWDHYDMTEVTHRPGSMEPEQLFRKMIEIHRQIYAWPVLLRKAVSTFWNTQSFTAMMFALMSNMNYRRVAPRK